MNDPGWMDSNLGDLLGKNVGGYPVLHLYRTDGKIWDSSYDSQRDHAIENCNGLESTNFNQLIVYHILEPFRLTG